MSGSPMRKHFKVEVFPAWRGWFALSAGCSYVRRHATSARVRLARWDGQASMRARATGGQAFGQAGVASMSTQEWNGTK